MQHAPIAKLISQRRVTKHAYCRAFAILACFMDQLIERRTDDDVQLEPNQPVNP
jgi:hypothetical protein